MNILILLLKKHFKIITSRFDCIITIKDLSEAISL